MKAPSAFKDSATSGIIPAVLAIGRSTFPQALICTLRRVANVRDRHQDFADLSSSVTL